MGGGCWVVWVVGFFGVFLVGWFWWAFLILTSVTFLSLEIHSELHGIYV